MTPRPTVLSNGRHRLLIRLVVNGFTQACMMIATAVLVKEVFDSFLGSETTKTTMPLWWFGAALATTAMAIATLRMLERVDAERLGQNYTHHLRTHLFNHMCNVSPRKLQQRSRGGVLLRFVGDLTTLKQWVSLGLARLTVAGVTSVGTLCALMFISIDLALIVGAFLLTGAITVFVLGHWLEKKVREVRKYRSRLASNVSEKISALGSIQAYGQVNSEQQRVDRQSQRLVTAMVGRAKVIGGMRGIIELTTGLATCGALIMGALLVNQGEISIGTIVAAMSIVGLLTPALRDLGRVKEYWHGAVVSWEKMDNFLLLPVESKTTETDNTLPNAPVKLSFNNVYLDNSLYHFSAAANPGETIALVGPNGAGKSTVLALATALIRPSKGTIYLNNYNLANIQQQSVRETVSIISPDLPLLRGTIERNIRYRWPDAPDSEVAKVHKLCDLGRMLTELPKGLQTRVKEDGSNLSLGQRQRISLARAILGNPRLLLIDELDANLDPETALTFRRVISRYPGTVLMVTHRLDWAASADTIWYMQEGKLLETGCAATLLNGDGLTAQLFHHTQPTHLPSNVTTLQPAATKSISNY